MTQLRTNPARHSRDGRTLLELAVVLAISGTIGSTALEMGRGAQVSFQRSQCVAFVDQIRDAELSFMAERDVALALAPNPAALRLTRDARLDPGASGWTELGVSLQGQAPGRFEVIPTRSGFVVRGACDVDHDGKVARVNATNDLHATLDPRDQAAF